MRDFTLSCHHMQLSCHHMSRARIGHETRYLRHRKSNVYTSPVCKIKQGSHNTSTPLLRSRIYSTVGIRVGIGARRRLFLAVLRNTCFPRAIQRTVRGRPPGTSDRLIQRAIDFSPVSALRSTHPASGSHPVIARWGARAPQWRSGRPRAITIGWRGGEGGREDHARGRGSRPGKSTPPWDGVELRPGPPGPRTRRFSPAPRPATPQWHSE